MKSLIKIDYTLLDDYSKWENINSNNWSIASYLNQFYDVNTAIAFSKFFFPDFIEYKGCVILNFRFDQKIFDGWYEEFNGDIPSVEKYCNLYDVADYFQINMSNSIPEDTFFKRIDQLAIVLKDAWVINCNLLFPEKSIIVEVINEYEVPQITLYSGSN